MSRRPYRFVSRGRRELNKAFGARDIEAVKAHTARELQLLSQLHSVEKPAQCKHHNRYCGFCEETLFLCECPRPAESVKVICDQCKRDERRRHDGAP